MPNRSNNKRSRKQTQNGQVSLILRKVTKQDLVKFIKKYALNSPLFFNEFKIHFSDLLDIDLHKKYQEILQGIINSCSDEWGYLDYDLSYKVFDNIYELLDKAAILADKGGFQESFIICHNIIQEIADMAQGIDDSDGEIYSVFENTIEVLEEKIIAAKLSSNLKEQVFNFCISEYPKKKYNSFDFAYFIENIISDLIDNSNMENKFLKMLDKRFEIAYQEDNKSNMKRIIKQKIAYFKSKGKDEEANDISDKMQNILN